MVYRTRINYTAAQKTEEDGESMPLCELIILG